MAKLTCRRRVSGEGRQEKKLNVINYYATADISATIVCFFSSTDGGPRGPKRKLVSKWKQQRAHIEQRAETVATSGYQHSRDRDLATTLPQSTETSIVKLVNDFHRDGVSVPPAVIKIRASEESRATEDSAWRLFRNAAVPKRLHEAPPLFIPCEDAHQTDGSN